MVVVLSVPHICGTSGWERHKLQLPRKGNKKNSQGIDVNHSDLQHDRRQQMLPRAQCSAGVRLLAGHHLAVLQETSKGSIHSCGAYPASLLIW